METKYMRPLRMHLLPFPIFLSAIFLSKFFVVFCGNWLLALTLMLSVNAWNVSAGTVETNLSKTRPQHYPCHYTENPLVIDGPLDKPAWKSASCSNDFKDIEGDAKPKLRFRTRVEMLWDDKYFSVRDE